MATFGSTVTVEMLLGGVWTNITAYVREDPGVDITFGVQNESATADPATATLLVNNGDGRFTPRNTAGAYYGNLKKNTPLRVTVGANVRFIGEVAEFPPRWEASGADVWVPLTAAGILRRLQHAKSLESTLTTAVLALAAANANINGYWPIEDSAGSTVVASAFPGGYPGFLTGTPAFDAVDLGVGTHEVATWGGARADFVAAAGSSSAFTAGIYVQLPTSGLTGGEELLRVSTAGTAQSWRVLYSPASGGGVFLQVIASDGSTELLVSSAFTNMNGTTFYLKIEAVQSGGNVSWAFSASGFTTFSGSIASRTVGAPSAAAIGAGVIPIPAAAAVAIGHLILATSNTALFYASFDDGLRGYAGESVNTRLARLAAQWGISIAVTDAAPNTVEHGAQPDGTLLDVLRATEKADAGGILRDSINQIGLAYITRDARYNDNRSQLVLDYASGHLSPPLEPTDDDQNLWNDVKVNRINGSSARAALTSGPLSTAAYPSGAGPYPFEDSYAVAYDAQLPYLAQWILALGTIDETRFPAVTVDLVKNPGLVSTADAIRPGHRLRIENLPAFAGVTNVDLQVLGWKETLTGARRLITFVCAPGSVWLHLFELDDAVFGLLDQNRLAY